MPLMIRLDDDLVQYFNEHGKFGETHCDVMRRLLHGFQPSHHTPQPKGVRNAYPLLFGHALTNVVRALGALGWTEEEVRQALGRKKISLNPKMLRTQIGWGKQWGKRNPHCRKEHKPYGTEPPKLTSDQLAELKEGL